MSLAGLIPLFILVLAVCAGLALIEGRGGAVSAGATRARASRLDLQAEEFVRIALALAQHEPAEVDAYFGPESLRPAARVPLPALARRAHHLVDVLSDGARALDPRAGSREDARRVRLLAQVRALATVLDVRVAAAHLTFDDEARAIYGMSLEDASAAGAGAVSGPTSQGTRGEREREPAAIESALAVLERALPGDGPLAARFAAYRARFAVPSDRRRALFAAALDGCRARTLAHWALPADERFEVKWQIGAPGAWHRYEGRRHSTLTINPGAVEFIDTAIDLACHEGYPGHHAQFLLAESDAGANATTPHASDIPIEDTIALLRSPVSTLREGAAQHAVDLAFPADERLRFERDVLFPIAGFAPDDAARYFEIRQLVRALEPAITPILRDYRDGRLSADEAAARLEGRALVSSPRALLAFVDDLGPYVLGYTVARARVAAHIARVTSTGDSDPWTALRTLLAPPDISVLSLQPEPPSATN